MQAQLRSGLEWPTQSSRSDDTLQGQGARCAYSKQGKQCGTEAWCLHARDEARRRSQEGKALYVPRGYALSPISSVTSAEQHEITLKDALMSRVTRGCTREQARGTDFSGHQPKMGPERHDAT